ncbi:MAG: tetratricopeptide repeat protein [Myxococcales bacterium]|nr:tetratricopeptide repeat protein [Myxococcales bacterium]
MLQATVRMTRQDRESYQTGTLAFSQGNNERALESLTRVLDACPHYADVHYMVGLLHERRGDLEAATASLERAIDINPRYVEATLALSSLCERSGDFARSRELSELLAKEAETGALEATTRGKLANLQAAVGDAYREVGDLREAIAAYRKALDRCPNFHDIRYRLAVTLREQSLPTQAIAELTRILRANEQYAEARVQLGLTYYTLGRLPEAIAAWRTVAAAEPAREDARMYLRMVRETATDGGAETDSPASQTSPGPDSSLELSLD